MTRRFLASAVMLTMLTGCVDTMDSVSREYRNAINECIDAMMMVTTEELASEMTLRVFKPSNDRFQNIDRKLKVFEANRGTFDFVKEAYEADGFYLLDSDLQYNRERYALEKTRLRSVRDDILKAYKEQLAAQGAPKPDATAAECCPKLNDLLNEATALKPLEDQLKTPPLLAKVAQMRRQLRDDKGTPLDKIFNAKSPRFEKEIKDHLVN